MVLSAIPQVLEYDGQLFPSAPEHVFMALGAFGQLLMVDAERDLVLVRLHDYFDINSDPLTLDQSDGLWRALEDAHS